MPHVKEGSSFVRSTYVKSAEVVQHLHEILCLLLDSAAL